ncbi:MAG: NlpC/P60 family protein [Coriobacteriia bacterium]|nr:NlpC/P60 family protein [Coriobacteriia bacterium]
MSLASGHRVRVIAAVVGAALTLSSPGIALAVPATPEISQKQAEAASAQAGLDRMRSELEVKIEEYNAITEALELTQARIVQTRAELEQATSDLRESEARLAERASNIYKHGGIGILDVFLGVRTFDDLITRVDLLRRINASDAATVASVREARATVEQMAGTLEQRKSEQLVLQADAEARANAIEDEVARQERYVAQLGADVRRLITQEEERERALAEQRAREAAEAARRATPAAGSGTPAGSSGAERPAADPGSLPAAPGGVVAIALQYLGVPYVYGGSTPAGFDCSGFVQYVYRQVGVSLPRTSRAQYGVGQHIAADRVDLLQPGDLVFFGTNGDPSRVHHVGMYVGGGDYIHAPYTGTVVRINSLTARIQSSGDYVGASRL